MRMCCDPVSSGSAAEFEEEAAFCMVLGPPNVVLHPYWFRLHKLRHANSTIFRSRQKVDMMMRRTRTQARDGRGVGVGGCLVFGGVEGSLGRAG